VEEAFVADVTKFIGPLQDAIAALEETASAAHDATESIAALQASLDSLHGRTIDVGVDVSGARAAASAVDDFAAAEAILAHELPDISADLIMQTALLGEIRDHLLETAGAVTIYNNALGDSGARAAAAGAGAAAAAAGFRLFGTGVRVTTTALHWIIAGAAEFLAVAVPALIAFGAGAFVAMQGAVNLFNHMNALYDTLEAVGPVTHQTMGDVLGLGHAMQTAQDAANPGVYELLGSAINDAKTHFTDLAGAGLQVVHMLDEFSARVTVDLQGALGGQLHALLGGMVTDLQQFGQVFGNIGHALLNFAAAMPGLAHYLLATADAISRVILAISSLPAWIITTVMALEEFYRWGGVVLGLMIRLAAAPAALYAWLTGVNFITKFGAALSTIVGTIGTVLVRLGGLVAGLGAADGVFAAFGAAVADAGGGLLAFAAMSPLAMAAVAGVAAVAVGLIVVLGHVKDATDQWVASTDKAVQSASDLNVLGVIGKTLTDNAIRLAAAQAKLAAQVHDAGTQSGYMTARFGAMNGVVERSAQDVQDLTQQQQLLVGVAANVITNAGALGRAFHTSAVGALFLANAAGVNLQLPLAKSSEAMKIAEQQIRNLITGLGAMGAPAGMVGQDMTAMGIQAQLAGTKVQQLNQAQDAWTASITGGMAIYGQFQTTLLGISHAAAAMHQTGTTAANTWIQLAQVFQQGNGVLDTLRTGMAEGVVSAGQFRTAVQGMVGEMIPFVAGNKVAVAWLQNIAHEAGGPASGSLKDLANWAGVSGDAARNQLAKGLENAAVAMSDMSKVASNLSAVINSQLDAAMASAIAKTLNISQLTQTYTNNLHQYGAQAPQTQAAQNRLNNALQQAYQMGQRAAKGLNDTAASAGHLGAQAAGAAGQARSLAAALAGLHSKSIIITTVFRQLGQAGGTTYLESRGHAAGTPSAPPGWAWVGELGPELMRFHGGEQVLSSAESQRFLTSPGHGGSGHWAGFTGTINLAHTTHVHATVDQGVLFEAMKTETLQYDIRNGSPQSGSLAPPVANL
jgi:hypothetical protein